MCCNIVTCVRICWLLIFQTYFCTLPTDKLAFHRSISVPAYAPSNTSLRLIFISTSLHPCRDIIFCKKNIHLRRSRRRTVIKVACVRMSVRCLVVRVGTGRYMVLISARLLELKRKLSTRERVPQLALHENPVVCAVGLLFYRSVRCY